MERLYFSPNIPIYGSNQPHQQHYTLLSGEHAPFFMICPIDEMANVTVLLFPIPMDYYVYNPAPFKHLHMQ